MSTQNVPDVTSAVTCPGCDGRKQVHAHLNYGGGRGEWKDIDCITCGGAGTITHEQVTRMRWGKRLRADRQARDMSLHEEAKRLGITASELSAYEMGFKEIPKHMRPATVGGPIPTRSEP